MAVVVLFTFFGGIYNGSEFFYGWIDEKLDGWRIQGVESFLCVTYFLWEWKQFREESLDFVNWFNQFNGFKVRLEIGLNNIL